MNDTTTTLQELKDAAKKLVDEREWNQFHSPKNLAMAISIESAELMEKLLWTTTQDAHAAVAKNRQEVEHELADVVIAALMFANATNIDLSGAIRTKFVEIAAKYPVEKAKGSSEKYTKL